MLADKELKAFVPTVKPIEAKSFYKDILGLQLLSEDNYALEFERKWNFVKSNFCAGVKAPAFYRFGLECWRYFISNQID